jgi:hypothetical protein
MNSGNEFLGRGSRAKWFTDSHGTRLSLLLFSCVVCLGFHPAAQALTNLNVRLVSSIKPSPNPLNYGDVWAENDLACLGVWLNYSTYNYGVGIFTITNPAAPVLLSVYSPNPTTQNQFELGAVRNRIGYFGSWSGGGLHIVSLTNPAAPVLLCRVGAITGNVTNGFDRVHTIWIERNYLYEAAHVPGIVSVKVFDISNPSMPVYLQDIVTTNTTKVHQITVRTRGTSTILYTSGWGGNDNGNPASPGQTDIWDVSNVGVQPAQWLGRVYSGYNSHSSYPTPDGNTLVVCRETPGGDVKLYDISNPAGIPTNPIPLVTLAPASMGLEADIPHNPVVVGNYLFLSWYQNGIQIFDITDRAKPVRVGFYDTYLAAETSSYQGNWGVFPYLGFDKVLVSDIQSGMYVMDFTAAVTPTNNYPPLIITQPSSLTVTQGATAILSATVTGSSPSYQWRFNAANIAGATASSLALTNIQPTSAGSYSLVVSNATAAITSSTASLSVLISQSNQTTFYENFDLPSANTNWNVFDGSANGTSDYTVTWAHDYNSYFSAFNGSTIPSAPNSTNGSTKGVKLTVNNNDGVGATAAVSLYPKNLNLSGAYKLKFDLWINYPGTSGGSGSTGSTEYSTFGINHTGSRVNWDSSAVNPSDGVWFAADGEGGDSNNKDYRAYEGRPAGPPTNLTFAASGLSASGAASANNTDSYFQSLFPAPTYETAGSPGKRWVDVEVSQDANNVVTWRINGSLIAQRVNTSPFTNGTIMIGYMDTFNSIANPAADAFVLFDNVRVEIPAAAVPPAISAQPQNISLYPQQDALFSVAATGSAPLSFQWQFNGANIPGATSNSFSRMDVQPEDVGSYSVVISNPAGSITSSNALLLLLDSPYLSGVRATPGARSALISWNSSIPANSQVQFDPAGTQIPGQSALGNTGNFGQTSYLDPALTTNHVILLTGLAPGTRYSFQVISIADTNTYVSGVYQFTTVGTIILDNPVASLTGSWTVSNSSTDKFSTDYAFATTVSGTPNASATFRPNITTPGKYNVSVWYPQGANRATNAPYTISYNGGSTTVFVNQQIGGGTWQLIAAGINFAAGTNGYVSLSNNAGPNVVIADAVRFSYVESQEFPSGQAIPTWWQNFYFGGPIDPAADPDGDGYSTAQEYVMGTSPTNPASRLLLSSEIFTNNAQISFWPMLGNRSYRLLWRLDIGDPNWQNVNTAPVPAADGHGLFNLSISNSPRGFYRLKVLLTNDSSTASFVLPSVKSYSPFASDPICGPNRAYIK